MFFANGLLVHNKGCFLPDTPITMADGRQQAISTIRIGDRVLAFTPDGLPSPATQGLASQSWVANGDTRYDNFRMYSLTTAE